ncbi:MAG: hypothetical protein RSC06_05395, partial [Clostridia bacterium]
MSQNSSYDIPSIFNIRARVDCADNDEFAWVIYPKDDAIVGNRIKASISFEIGALGDLAAALVVGDA